MADLATRLGGVFHNGGRDSRWAARSTTGGRVGSASWTNHSHTQHIQLQHGAVDTMAVRCGRSSGMAWGGLGLDHGPRKPNGLARLFLFQKIISIDGHLCPPALNLINICVVLQADASAAFAFYKGT